MNRTEVNTLRRKARRILEGQRKQKELPLFVVAHNQRHLKMIDKRLGDREYSTRMNNVGTKYEQHKKDERVTGKKPDNGESGNDNHDGSRSRNREV